MLCIEAIFRAVSRSRCVIEVAIDRYDIRLVVCNPRLDPVPEALKTKFSIIQKVGCEFLGIQKGRIAIARSLRRISVT